MEKLKTFNVRLVREDWRFLKVYAAEKEMSMNEAIKQWVKQLQKKEEKKVDTK